MKKLIAIAALATAAISTPAFAGSLTGEVRFDLDTNGAWTRATPAATEYRVEYWDAIGAVKVGAELQALQAENAGGTNSLVSVKAGPNLPSVAGLQLAAYGEVGKSLGAGNNFEFWGGAVTARKDIIGPLSVNAGYRHREGFAAGDMNEERLHAGVGYDVTDKLALGATFYRTRGSIDADAVGVSVTRKF